MNDLADLFPGFESHWIPTSAGKLFARTGGSGPPLLLLHGYSQMHVMWHRVAPDLAKSFSLIIPDLPGYGWSEVPEADANHAPYDKRSMAKAMVELMEKLGHVRFRLAGHDRGGRVSYRLALDHPGRLEKLATLDIVPTYDMWHGMNRNMAMKVWHWPFLAQPAPLPEMLISKAPVEYLEYKMKSWTKAKNLSTFDPRAMEHYRRAFSDPIRIHAHSEDYRAGRYQDLANDEADRAAGKKIECPMLALWGDAGIPSETGGPLPIWQQWATNVRGAPVDSGHFLTEENPAVTSKALLEFFSRMTALDRQAAFTGTKEVPDALRFDTAALEKYLTQHARGFSGPLKVSQFKGGQSNPTYLLETPARKYVLRRKPPGKLLPSAHAVDREFRVISALFAQGFPAAEPVVYCEDDSVAGTAFYVMGFVGGRVFWEPNMPDSNPAERAAVYDAMNATIAQLHGYEPEKIGLADYGKSENYVGRQVARWSKQYRASETETIEEMNRLIDWLPQHVPPQLATRVVHGDYRLDNMIIDADAPKVLAVLDWELSTLGDPLADFAYHLMAWHMPFSESAAGTATLVGQDLAALGIPPMRDYVEAYVRRTHLDPRPHLDFYLAYNFFRIAAILQGIVGRVRDGTATSDHAPAKASMIRPLAKKAWEFAQSAGA